MMIDETTQDGRFSILYRETFNMFYQNADGEDRDYWQGRKDAMRLVYAILDPERKESMKRILESSPGYIPTDQEFFHELIADGVYNAAAIVWEIEEMGKPDRQTIANLRAFVRDYESAARDGKLPVIDDHCLVY
jgi:hypothetical protein